MNELAEQILNEIYRVRRDEHRQPKAIRISKPALKAALAGTALAHQPLFGSATLFGVPVEYVDPFEVIA